MTSSPVMERGIFELEKDVGKTQFQQELNKWFESRGIIADLRSHLRHLMIMALQSAQIGLKPADRSSPKAQAISLMVAEYLFTHGCHYTLSVFTSEIPNLVSFHPDVVLQGKKAFDVTRKRSKEKCFQENEIEEIFNALGMSSHEEELMHLKTRYLEKGNDSSLVELFLQTLVEMSTKLLILQNLKSHDVEGERLLSEEWSSRIVDILLNEKITSPRIAALEESIFRVTENEMRKVIENERRLQIRLLSERERRIQEYLKKHKDEILFRLIEAEKDLTMRKDIIDEELSEREKHLTEMVMEWRNKHEEILKLSKNFHNIENENKALQGKLKALEEENMNLKTQRITHTKTIDDLLGEMNSMKNKLQEATDSNVTLSEQIKVLINKGNKEVFICHDNVNQKNVDGNSDEIPLLWPDNIISDCGIDPLNHHNSKSEPKVKCKEFIEKDPALSHRDQWNMIESVRTPFGSNDAQPNKTIFNFHPSEDGNVSLSSSSEEVMLNVRKRLKDLEEETDRINHSYLEYKLKCVSVESDSESSKNPSAKSLSTVNDEIITRENKFCQTNTEDPLIKIQKLKDLGGKKTDFFGLVTKKSEEVTMTKPLMRTPTKRQLQHRDFFIKSRQLLQTLQKENLEDFQGSLLITESDTSGSEEEYTESYKKFNKKSSFKPVLPTFLRTISVHSNKTFEIKNEPSSETVRKLLTENTNHILKEDLNCLALLEEARIKSPQVSGRLRLSGSEKEDIEKKTEDDEKIEKCSETILESPEFIYSEKVSFGKKSESYGVL